MAAMERNTMFHRRLLILGWLNPLLFWSTTLLCGFILGDYNHLSNLVSELGALGTRTQYLFTAGLVTTALLNLFWVYALFRASKEHRINPLPVVFLLFFSFIAGPALFPMPLPAHGQSGVPFLLLLFSPPLALFLWQGDEYKLKLRIPAAVSTLLFLLGFLIYFPDILSNYFGLKQRFLYAGWTLWSIFLSLRFRKLYQKNLIR
jgi:hypothetical protein